MRGSEACSETCERGLAMGHQGVSRTYAHTVLRPLARRDEGGRVRREAGPRAGSRRLAQVQSDIFCKAWS